MYFSESLRSKALMYEFLKGLVKSSAVIKSGRSKRIKVVRERISVFCVFVSNENKDKIREFITKTDFSFSLFLPVVVDVNGGSVYHAPIPLNKSFAKGKALVKLSQLVSSVFINNQAIKNSGRQQFRPSSEVFDL